MKKLSNKGFTLIELLAVITIMGILMMVAIPAVSRTIENSRRDTFANVAQTYINTVRNSVLADELQCGGTNVSATKNGIYYFQIDSAESDPITAVQQQTADLMESGGNSSWGNAPVNGYVIWHKSTHQVNGVNETKTEYYVTLTDTGEHGFNTPAKDQKVKRASVITSGQTAPAVPTAASIGAPASTPVTACTLS